MYQLYGLSGSCSMTTHALLICMQQPFEYHSMTPQSIKQPEFLKLNPRGNVPLLLDDGFSIRENVAIISYLCDKHGCSGWTQDLGTQARATQMQWLAYCNSTLHGTYMPAFKAAFGGYANEQTKQDILNSSQTAIQSLWDELDQTLSTRAYLSGDAWGPADVYMSVIAGWNKNLPMLTFTLGSNVQRVIKTVSSQPWFQQAVSEEHTEYKVAA